MSGFAFHRHWLLTWRSLSCDMCHIPRLKFHVACCTRLVGLTRGNLIINFIFMFLIYYFGGTVAIKLLVFWVTVWIIVKVIVAAIVLVYSVTIFIFRGES